MITFVSIQIKKYMKKVLISLLAMLFTVSCVVDGGWEDIPKSIVQIDGAGYISMHVVPDKLPRASDYTTLVFENHTTHQLGYGSPYDLEFYNGGKWQAVDLDVEFTMPYYTLNREAAKEQRISIPSKHHIAGKYRVVKTFDLLDTDNFIDICAEFVLE